MMEDDQGLTYGPDGNSCDGIHDEEAPPQYLCSRCFPYGEIPPPQDDEDDGDLGCKEPQETE